MSEKDKDEKIDLLEKKVQTEIDVLKSHYSKPFSGEFIWPNIKKLSEKSTKKY